MRCLLLIIAAITQALAVPFYPVSIQRIAVPENVYPWLPTFTPDGKFVLFQNQFDGNVWLSDMSGSMVKCITCNVQMPEQMHAGFTYALPDNKRVFIAKRELVTVPNLADDNTTFDAYIMECSSCISDCDSPLFFPVDMAGDKTGSYPPLQRRTWHLTPDGRTIAWTVVRQDGSAVVAGSLTKEGSRYVVTDMKVINPLGPQGARSSGTDKLDFATQLWELKSFVDGGESALFVTELNNNVNVAKVNLRTGVTTLVTRGLEWDEDGASSPDGQLYALYSSRTRHRMKSIALATGVRSFIGLPLMLNLLVQYVSTWEAFQCDLSPWLLPPGGDDHGKLIGQPLVVYDKSENRVPGNNLAGQPFWSPDSTKVLLQSRNHDPVPPDFPEEMQTKGMMNNEILIAHIDRTPTDPQAVRRIIIGDWAPQVRKWEGPFDAGQGKRVRVRGNKGGTADFTYRGHRGVLDGKVTVIYSQFTDDGKTFINGEATLHMGTPSTVFINIVISGEHTGYMAVDVINRKGMWEIGYDGLAAHGLPPVGPCDDVLPQKTPLDIVVKIVDNQAQVAVSATIAGDSRPVQNAVVAYGTNEQKTNARGIATIPLDTPFTVNAGDTFTAARPTPSYSLVFAELPEQHADVIV